MIKALFPVIIICLSFWAAIVYGFHRDWLHMIYWMSASMLNSAVLMMGDL